MRCKLGLVLIFVLLLNMGVVFGYEFHDDKQFHGKQGPWAWVPVDWEGKCPSGCFAHPPTLISNAISEGTIVRTSNIQGQVSWGEGLFVCNEPTGVHSFYPYAGAVMGFYDDNKNQIGNDISLIDFQNSVITSPPGATHLYAYENEGEAYRYSDNFYHEPDIFKCTFDVEIIPPFETDCDDGQDNDNDGKTDALVNLNPNNGETVGISSYEGGPSTLRNLFNNKITEHNLGYTQIPALSYILRGDSVNGLHSPTLDKVCEVFGYDTVVASTCQSGEGNGCNFDTPSPPNYLYYWDGNDFVAGRADGTPAKNWLTSITCINRLSQCNDGWDNDGDTFVDVDDNGCWTDINDPSSYNPNDDSEIPHDSDCAIKTDCNDNIDNDNDGLTDFSGETYLKVSFNMAGDSADGNSYLYQRLIDVENYVIQGGDHLEYDVYWTSGNDLIAFDYSALDEITQTYVFLRDSGSLDRQRQLNAHPGSDLHPHASNKWYHRTIPLPASHEGKKITHFDIACENDDDVIKTAYFKNIYITNGYGIINKVIYGFDSSTNNNLHFVNPDGASTVNFFNEETGLNPDPGCGDLRDNSEYLGTQCDDGLENDDIPDGIDFCRADGSNHNTCDPDCDSIDDENGENTDFILEGGYWANMKNEPIPNERIVNKNSLVKLMVAGMGNAEIDFTIYKEGGVFRDIIEFITFGIVDSGSPIGSSYSVGFTTWRAGKKNGGFEEELPEDYYFIAEVDGESIDSRYLPGGGDNPFGILSVSNEEVNIPPEVNIVTPIDRQIYFLNEILTFKAEISDEDDEFDYIWDLGDGSVLSGDSESMVNSEFQRAYTTPGQKNIVLTVTDGRGLVVKDRISILIVNSPFVMSYIESPESESVHGREVRFDASGSYAVDSSLLASEGKITCLAGDCPSKTKGRWPGNGEQIDVENAPATPADADYSNIGFEWIINGETSSETGFSFDKVFVKSKWHTVQLKSSIDSSSSTSGLVEFFTETPGAVTCYLSDNEDDLETMRALGINADSGESYWYDEEAGFLRADDESNSCYDDLGISSEDGGEMTSCCPRLKPQCDQLSNKCVGSVLICSQIKDKEECNSVAKSVARTELEGDEVNLDFEIESWPEGGNDKCRVINDYGCEWILTEESGDGCRANYRTLIDHKPDNKKWAFDDFFNDDDVRSIIESLCSVEPTQDEELSCTLIPLEVIGDCSSGEDSHITIKYDYNQKGSIECPPPGEKIISCENYVRLGFFNLINLVVAVLIIVVIYYLFYIKKSEKKTKRKNK